MVSSAFLISDDALPSAAHGAAAKTLTSHFGSLLIYDPKLGR